MDSNSAISTGENENRTAKSLAALETAWLDIGEASLRLGVSEKTVRRRIKSNKIAARKIRGVWFVAVPQSSGDSGILPETLPPSKQTLSQVHPSPIASDAHLNERLKKMENDTEYILKKLTAIDRTLEVRDRNLTFQLTDLNRQAETIDRLTVENKKLQDEVLILREEAIQLRQNIHPKDTHTLKNKMEEIIELKATIASNQRGLALLRDEVNEKEKNLKEKEQEVLLLREKIHRMEANTENKRKNWGAKLFFSPKSGKKEI
ncbi:MAG: helix-turn-helix domain-containing protein [bacterium]